MKVKMTSVYTFLEENLKRMIRFILRSLNISKVYHVYQVALVEG